jgi:hypothetical protein
MSAQKFLHIRIPHDLHQQLTQYASDRFIPVSSVVLQAVASTIGYKPRPAAPRSFNSTPVQVQPQAQPPVDDLGMIPDSDGGIDLDWEDLQRRAAAAPLRPVG